MNQNPGTPGPCLRLTLDTGNTITFPYLFGYEGFNLTKLADEIETAKAFNGVVKIEAYSSVSPQADSNGERFVFHTWEKDDDIADSLGAIKFGPESKI